MLVKYGCYKPYIRTLYSLNADVLTHPRGRRLSPYLGKSVFREVRMLSKSVFGEVRISVSPYLEDVRIWGGPYFGKSVFGKVRI